MLKRNGQLIRHAVPGFRAKLTDPEMSAYQAAFSTIEGDYRQIESIKTQLDRLAQVDWNNAGARPFDWIITSEGHHWGACARLLKLPRSEVLLCRGGADDEFAVIQRFQPGGLFAKKRGAIAILMTGRGGERANVADYIAQARHTLRFMARNLVAQVQRVVWEEYPECNPSRVVRAISERCARAVDKPQSLSQAQNGEERLQPSRGIRI